MKKHWCLNLLGVADPEDPNKYATILQVCDYVFDQCDAHNNDYTNPSLMCVRQNMDQINARQFFKDIHQRVLLKIQL